MTPAQIKRLERTEKRLTHYDQRAEWWHYRRANATQYRDAVWQYTDRSAPDGQWHTLPHTPPREVLARLVPKGWMTVDGIRWQGFHDPDEYARGY